MDSITEILGGEEFSFTSTSTGTTVQSQNRGILAFEMPTGHEDNEQFLVACFCII